MKRQLFIIAGAVIVLFLILVWAYLLFFGTPETAEDVFAELGLSGEVDDTAFVPPPVVEETPVANIEKPKLRQLTTKLVAGYREIVDENGIPSVYYVEMGTGHVYSISLSSNEEKRLSGTTIKNAYKAVFSPKGDYLAIASLANSKNMDLVVGQLSTTSEGLALTDFSETVRDFSVSDNNELLYTKINEQAGLSGYTYSLPNRKQKDLFTLPFTEAVVRWSDEGSTGSQYIYPKPSYAFEGFLYEVKNGKISRLPAQGFGFSAWANDDMILYSYIDEGSSFTNVYNRESGEEKRLSAMILPEKCLTPKVGLVFVCAYEPVKTPYEFPDSWYRGETSFKDSLYAISGTEITSQLLVNTFTESKREIDAINFQTDAEGTMLYFINKNDNSLWMYEI